MTGLLCRCAIVVACSALLIVSSGSSGQKANADESTTPTSSTPAPGPDGSVAVLLNFDDTDAADGWTTVNDPVMGGRSTSTITNGPGGLVFSGSISLDNNGGFASARSPQDPGIGSKAAGARSLRVHAVGDGKTYLLKVGAAGQPWSYIQRFPTEAAVERIYDLSVAGFRPVGIRLDPAPEAPQSMDPSTISAVSVYILDKQQGPFAITISEIDAAA